MGIILQIGHFKSPIEDFFFFFQLGIGDLFSGSALAVSLSAIPNPKLGVLAPTGDLIFPIGDIIPNWGYFFLVVYCP